MAAQHEHEHDEVFVNEYVTLTTFQNEFILLHNQVISSERSMETALKASQATVKVLQTSVLAQQDSINELKELVKRLVADRQRGSRAARDDDDDPEGPRERKEARIELNTAIIAHNNPTSCPEMHLSPISPLSTAERQQLVKELLNNLKIHVPSKHDELKDEADSLFKAMEEKESYFEGLRTKKDLEMREGAEVYWFSTRVLRWVYRVKYNAHAPSRQVQEVCEEAVKQLAKSNAKDLTKASTYSLALDKVRAEFGGSKNGRKDQTQNPKGKGKGKGQAQGKSRKNPANVDSDEE